MLLPYFVGAAVITVLSLFLNNYVIPNANKTRLGFEETFIRNTFRNLDRNIHRQIGNNTFIYFERYDNQRNTGYKFSLEKIENGLLTYKLMSEYIKWDSTTTKWRIQSYFIREINGLQETVLKGAVKDTSLNFTPSEFGRRINNIETMNIHELNNFINSEKSKGSSKVVFYEIEKHKRIAFPFATFILTLIGVCVASTRVRGGIGLHIGLGMLISFSYILFMQISLTFSTNANLSPFIATWIPNILFTLLALVLYKKAAQ
jgi:lipopolysaccharide export system permease protein